MRFKVSLKKMERNLMKLL